MNNENALLFFHQGWTDIINCLAMINIYAAKYKKLYILVREDAWYLIQYYIRGLRNVIPIYAPHKTLNQIGFTVVDIAHHNITKLELMGHLDIMRPINDPMRDAYQRFVTTHAYKRPDGTMSHPFERVFYEAYGIPYSDRVHKFTLYRDPDLEETVYNRVVKEKPYICVHSNPALNLMICPNTTLPRIELNQSSDIFFDYIRVLQHAEELHLIDSVWAAICYMLDAKYGIFHGKPVYVYCYRNFERMFSEPVTLPNWKIISAEDSCKQRDKLGMAFVSFANGSYKDKQDLLVKSVHTHNPMVPVFTFHSFEEIGSPSHEENPYAFKVYCIDKLRKWGYKIIFWCDSVLRLTQSIETLLPQIEERGVYLQKDGWNTAQWANDKCLEYFGLTRNKAESIECIYASFMAFDFRHPITEEFFTRWRKACDDGIFRGAWKNDKQTESRDWRCKGHRHDQSCAEIISHQLGIPRGDARVRPGEETPERYFSTWKHI